MGGGQQNEGEIPFPSAPPSFLSHHLVVTCHHHHLFTQILTITTTTILITTITDLPPKCSSDFTESVTTL
jgi:hypothetical protein